MDFTRIKAFLEILGLSEDPFGMFYTNTPPANSITPRPNYLPSLEDEAAGKVEWEIIDETWFCIVGIIWRARRKQKAACFDPGHYACAEGAFHLGFLKPMFESAIQHVFTGVPGERPGERYLSSPNTVRKYCDILDPEPAPDSYTVFKPLSQFTTDEDPEFITFFGRPEIISGLHQLATFVTDDMEVVKSPWSSGCGSMIAWPRFYKAKGELKAVLGGWDISCRPYLKTDELFITIPNEMLILMLENWEKSFLTTEAWNTSRKKISRSNRAWKEV